MSTYEPDGLEVKPRKQNYTKSIYLSGSYYFPSINNVRTEWNYSVILLTQVTLRGYNMKPSMKLYDFILFFKMNVKKSHGSVMVYYYYNVFQAMSRGFNIPLSFSKFMYEIKF